MEKVRKSDHFILACLEENEEKIKSFIQVKMLKYLKTLDSHFQYFQKMEKGKYYRIPKCHNHFFYVLPQNYWETNFKFYLYHFTKQLRISNAAEIFFMSEDSVLDANNKACCDEAYYILPANNYRLTVKFNMPSLKRYLPRILTEEEFSHLLLQSESKKECKKLKKFFKQKNQQEGQENNLIIPEEKEEIVKKYREIAYIEIIEELSRNEKGTNEIDIYTLSRLCSQKSPDRETLIKFTSSLRINVQKILNSKR